MIARGSNEPSDEFWWDQQRQGLFEVGPTDLIEDSAAIYDLAVKSSGGNRMMAGILYSYPFLDGGLVSCEKYDPDAWDDDVIDDGDWIVGNCALRAVCEVLGAPQPELLEGEVVIPSVVEIMRAADRGLLVSGDADVQAEAITWKTDIRDLAQKASSDWLSRG